MNTTLRNACLTAVFSIALLPQAQAEEKKPEHEFSANLGLTSDYRYRGLSQSRLQPALQGGVDYSHNPTGWYAGAWASTIKWTKDAGGSGDLELDLYGGKKGEISKDFSYDVGLLTYVYPSNGLKPNANTTEVYGQLGFGPAWIKYSHSVSNLFAVPDSKNSGYLDVGANIDAGNGFTVNLHLGRQNVKGSGALSYTDYKLGVTKDFGVASVALAVVHADTSAYVSPAGKNLGKSGLVLSVSKTF